MARGAISGFSARAGLCRLKNRNEMGDNMKFLTMMAAFAAALAFAAPATADSLYWEVRSEHPNIVSLEFYSEDYDRAWPGGGEVYVLDDYDTHSYNLECSTGEKICMGAWVRGDSSSYWGVGRDARNSCESCCFICGRGDTGVQVLNE